MADLIIEPNIDMPDALYSAIIDAHDGKTDDESMRINARLVLILANHIGDRHVIGQALAIAAQSAARVDSGRDDSR